MPTPRPPSAATTIQRLTIGQSELFAGWPSETVDQLIASSELIRLEDGQVLHAPGDQAEFLYLIASGSIRLSLPGKAGRPFTVWLYFPGEFHGLGQAASGEAYTTLASARGQAQIVRLPSRLLMALVGANGRLAMSLIAALHRRRLQATERYERASTQSLRVQIGALFLSIQERSARMHRQNEVLLSQDEIAAMLGTRRQVVNRVLKDLALEGAVRVEYGRVAILDASRLSDVAAPPGDDS